MTTFLAFTVLGLFTGRGVRDRGQRAGAHLHDHPGLQHRPRRLRHGDGVHVLGLQPAQGLPTWLALILVLGVVAPLLGWLVQRFVTRGLGEAPGQRLAGRHRRAVRRADRAGAAASGRPTRDRAAVLRRPRRPGRRRLRHRPRAHHDRRCRRWSPAASTCCSTGPGSAPRCGRRSTTPSCCGCTAASPTGSPRWLGDRHLAGRARRHPADAGRRAGLLRPHAAGHQRVRRRDGRPAEEPAAGRSSARWGSASLAVVRGRPTCPADGLLTGLRAVVPALFLFVVIVADAAGAAAGRPGQGHRPAPLPSLPVGSASGRRAPRRCVVLLAALDVRRQPAAGRHRRDVRDGHALAGAADRVRRPRLARAVHLRRRRRAGLRASSTSPTSRPAPGRADRGRRRRAGRAAGAAADRALPRAVDAGVRRADGQAGLPGRLRLRLQRHARRRAALGPRHVDRLDRRLHVRDGGLLRR